MAAEATAGATEAEAMVEVMAAEATAVETGSCWAMTLLKPKGGCMDVATGVWKLKWVSRYYTIWMFLIPILIFVELFCCLPCLCYCCCVYRKNVKFCCVGFSDDFGGGYLWPNAAPEVKTADVEGEEATEATEAALSPEPA